LTLGADLSGTVTALGDGVTNIQIGDDVFGATNRQFTGANAEYAVALAAMLAPKPRRLGHIDAASIPVVAVTAWQMLFEHTRVAPGERVLILGAAGNVGAYAVQLARLVRAHVIAMAHPADFDFINALDADEIMEAKFTADEVEPVDVVIDLIGGEMQARALSTLKPGGILISAVSQPDSMEVMQRGLRANFVLVDVSTTCLLKLTELFEAGELETNIGMVLPLAHAREAHEMLEGMRSRQRGKIVLRTT
jgi:NADPH:quinone reductase-like Zn-dependent oxidoreductase